MTTYDLATTATNLPNLLHLADALGRSEMFDVKSPEQALVKLLTGDELGLRPAQAMRLVHVVEGKPMVGAQVYAAKLRQSGVYDYEVIQVCRECEAAGWEPRDGYCPHRHPDKVCGIRFFRTFGERDPKRWRLLGVHEVTWAQAEERGWTVSGKGTPKANWKRHPDAMLFARCISQGTRLFCAEVMEGIYIQGEVEPREQEGPTPHPDDIEVEARPVERELPPGACPESGGMHCWESIDGVTACRCGALHEVQPAEVFVEQAGMAGEVSSTKPATANPPGPGEVGETGGEAPVASPPEGTQPDFTACKTGKRVYSSKARAKAAHATCSARLRFYECPACGGWHATNDEKAKRPRRKAKPRKPKACEHPSVSPDSAGGLTCDKCGDRLKDDEPPAGEA